MVSTWRNAHAVCFDVDSTVCEDEGIDELAAFCGAGEAVAAWTARFGLQIHRCTCPSPQFATFNSFAISTKNILDWLCYPKPENILCNLVWFQLNKVCSEDWCLCIS